MNWVLIVGLLLNLVLLPIAARRVVWLYRLITSGQPDPGRVEGVTGRVGQVVKTQLVEVFAQQKLLKWTVPGAAHLFVFWAFLILATVYLEAYGVLLVSEDFAIPLIGHWEVLGFAQDLIAVLALVSLGVFAQIRLRNAPERLGRRSRFSGSHLGGAWMVLFMIFNVIWTMFLFRGAASALGNLPYDGGAFVSVALGNALDGLSEDALHVLEGIGLLLHIGVMLVFLVIVLNSKHLHIFVAPLNVMFKRQPVALGAARPLTSGGKAVTLDDLEDMDEDTKLGIGSIEDFSWKGMLDFATCTECGRCQDQCPAWNTEKPLSPKMLIMNMRDHAFHIGSYLQADQAKRDSMLEADPELAAEVERALVGATEGEAWHPTGGAVIDPDVLWSCVTCGACVQQCPVDIEHVDHIIDMRRHQVLVENNFPAELNQLFKGLESKGNPWNLSPNMRMDWAQGLDFEVPVVGEDLESLESVDWLFWVGCAGAYEDRAKKTTRAVAELLDIAGISFGVLGKGETCTGDSARRAGNEFVFQGLAQQNVETFKEFKVKKVVSTCAHCFNTLKNEYKEFGIELEVVHHTQLLNRLVREGRLTPVATGEGAAKRSITYHDPCYIGRHNQVYEPPRELLQVLPGAEFVEMERNSERSFCCGAGGARMWMEETIGERINTNRSSEAVGTGADQIAVGCPFCRVMLSDGVTALQDQGEAREEVEVLDVAQMLLASVKGEPATRQKKAAASASAAGGTATATLTRDEETAAEPEAGDATQTEGTITETSDAGPAAKASGGSSLFDLGGDDEPGTTSAEKSVPEEAAAAKPETSGGSLFDLGGDEPAAEPEPEKPAAAADDLGASGSLFDLGGDQPEAEPDKPSAAADDLGASGSLFDLGGDQPEAEAEPEKAAPVVEETTAETEPEKPRADLGSGGSLFDIAAPEPEPAPAAEASPQPGPAAAEAEAPEAEAPEVDAPETDASEPATAPASSEIPEGRSLFDIPAPEQAEKSDAPEVEVRGASATNLETPDADESASDGAALSEAATAAATDDAPTAGEEPQAPAEPDAESDSEPEPATDETTDESSEETTEDEESPEEPKPSSSGPSHQPRTDADINESGSLFDL
ncbi:(Fe-S)-binding protein [Nocardioides euryhalodurans]|uniref:4Fe-4S dicluster domain-containing protein n=1 Tax=Nocardioides euryhalodurans TaxID=2518370 RepID=A0A4P7GLZ2_9ACTN|nr:heterodisulfide reductase-related iron-sulfur binding cluster [Nocardioides euryhalodurans]QBR93165.1 4Fe-4S dicluster domain-containing protein [Nocardioides euryhalodurans]